MKKRLNALIDYHESLTEQLSQLEEKSNFPANFYHDMLSGKNELYQKDQKEIKKFDKKWLEILESYFPSIDKITREAKTVLRYDRDVRPIERAKKVDGDSIRHLASHTHYIDNIVNGDVMPKKILTTQAEVDLATYENRMVATLINRLNAFLSERFKLIKKNTDVIAKKHFNFNSNFKAQSIDVELLLEVKTSEKLKKDEQSLDNKKTLERIEYILKLIGGLLKTPFMRELANAKPVKAPILKTQIILKNVDYKNAYLLWTYLDRYDSVPFDLETSEKDLIFDQKYLKDVYQSALVIFSSIIANQKNLEFLYKYLEVKQYKKQAPKVIKALPDAKPDLETKRFQDNRINQYYLEQTKKHFHDILEEHLEESSTYEIGLKRALRDTIRVSNALYKSYFEFESEIDKDVFQYLVKKDLDQSLIDIKQKAKIAKMIREVKEVDYRESIRQEKRLLKEIAKVDRLLIKQNKKKIKDDAVREQQEIILKLEAENATINDQVLQLHEQYINQQQDEMKDHQLLVNQKLKDEAQKLKTYEKTQISKAKEIAKQKFLKEQKQIKQRLAREKERERLRKQKQKQKDLEKLRKEKERLKKQSSEKINKEKQKIQKTTHQKIQKGKQKVTSGT
jgi:DNA repair protein SbcC/Rad50